MPEPGDDVPGAPGPWAPARPEPPRRRSPARAALWWVLSPLLVWMGLVTVVGLLARSPYVTFAPGSATAAEPLISVPDEADDGGSGDGEGHILLTTVSVTQKPTYAQSLWGWWSQDTDVFPRQSIYGDQSARAARQRSLNLMDDSKAVAEKAALERLGEKVPESGTGVVILRTEKGFPVAEQLKAGDVVTAVDGQATETSRDLIDAVSSLAPGDEVNLTVERADGAADAGGPTETITTTLGRRQGTDEAILGVTIQTRDRRFDLPVDVEIESGDVGGPSAGLAFSLGVIEALTDASLTGGHTVAVTGEIAPDGSVLEVGGVGQKAVAARRQGATLFIVPAAEAGEARETAGDMAVAGVEDLDGALDALADIGGDTSALPAPGPEE